ncbi:hypothetical protein GGQ74_002642 [Desulfobaculum xiamenense]|uniref:Uncharacterized protein n=1 Tax=Desulfobaculum xiamenense TaxID=995050 RepID=A0A846QLA3_9BACT|nr:hypothetical protein [Desulfobaculum xiamenense]NJB68948.1 hypothetical protein [Desulfobaculum xiamenense]
MTIHFYDASELPREDIEVRCPTCGHTATHPYRERKRYSDICLKCQRRYSVHIFNGGMVVVE